MKQKINIQCGALLLGALLALLLVFCSSAEWSYAGAANAPVIEKTTYLGNGVLNVFFREKVTYNDARVYVTDKKGRSYETSVKTKNSGRIQFRIKNYTAGRRYNYTIQGIKVKGFRRFTSVRGSYYIAPKGKVAVRRIEYDSKDKEVTFTFCNDVSWRNARVYIYRKGRAMSCAILEKGEKKIQVKAKGLKYGNNYSYKISGVKSTKERKYGSIRGTFRACNR